MDAQEVSCSEARIVFKTIDFNQTVEELREVQKVAINHYSHCSACRQVGLAAITGCQMNCIMALEAFVTRKNAKRGGNFLETTRITIAQEHIFGRFGLNPSSSAIGACDKKICIGFRDYVKSGNLGYPGQAISNEISFLMQVFEQEGWMIDTLLSIQKDLLAHLPEKILTSQVSANDAKFIIVKHHALLCRILNGRSRYPELDLLFTQLKGS